MAFGLLQLAFLQTYEGLVGIRLLGLGVDAQRTLEIAFGRGVIALLECQRSQVVVGAIVLVVEFGGLLVDGFLLGCVVFERSRVEQFLDVELGRVGGILRLDLFVAAADGLVVDDEACAAQFGQNLVGQFAEAFAHVANLLLALLRVFIHGEHAQDDVLVLDVAGLHQLLEAVPVLRRVVGVDVGLHLGALELSLHVAFADVLALVGQLVVEAETAFGRRIGGHLDILDGQPLTVGVDGAQHSDELLHAVVLQFALAQVGLVDEEAHVGLLLPGVDALEGVGGDTGAAVHHGAAVELRRGEHAVGHLDGRNLHLLLVHAGLEGEVHFALLHLGHVVERRVHRVATAQAIGDRLVVAHHLLALERGTGALGGASVGIAEFGNDGDRGVLLQILLGELAGDGGRHFAARGFERVGRYVEVVGRQRSHLGTRGKKDEGEC